MPRQSQFRNVFWYRRTGRWLVKLHDRYLPNGKETVYLGYYDDEKYAARVADAAEEALYGSVLQPNFPNEPLLGPQRSAVLDKLAKQRAIDIARLKEAARAD